MELKNNILVYDVYPDTIKFFIIETIEFDVHFVKN